ncbi:MAG TPA: YfiR family protein [Gammaproteobacteria bacterium]|nr:YfiR family protein [Gammaproteobacteria bacterium]
MKVLTPLPRVIHRLPHVLAMFMAASFFWVAGIPRVVAATDAGSLEYAVKAAYLYKFGFYVEWPSTALPSPTSPINLCVIGEDPFGTALDTAVHDQTINAHPIVIKRLESIGRDSGCHILYIGGMEIQRVSQIIDAVRGSGVLTVTDMQGSGAISGIVNFVIKDDRVRFDIDEDAASQNGLAISSKLLSLAVNVKQKSSKEIRQ